jgi:hypothetical protein
LYCKVHPAAKESKPTGVPALICCSRLFEASSAANIAVAEFVVHAATQLGAVSSAIL